MIITGNLNLNKYKVDDLVKMKKANLMLLTEGVNPDGSRSQDRCKVHL